MKTILLPPLIPTYLPLTCCPIIPLCFHVYRNLPSFIVYKLQLKKENWIIQCNGKNLMDPHLKNTTIQKKKTILTPTTKKSESIWLPNLLLLKNEESNKEDLIHMNGTYCNLDTTKYYRRKLYLPLIPFQNEASHLCSLL